MQPKPIVFCDFDGTITQIDVTDLILTELAHPSWRQVEQEWVSGSIGSRECLERQMALVGTSEPQLKALIDSVPLDPHFAGFWRFLEERRIPFYVVSDGFDYIIRRLLKAAGVNGQFRNGSQLFASTLGFDGRRLVTSFPYATPDCRHGCATCKAAVIRRLSRGRRPVVFIGDGLSDRFAVEESDVVFAKGSLLAYCRETGIDGYAFETFADVRKELSRQLTIDLPASTGATQQVRINRRQEMRLALVRTEKI
jgi:2,3-diketo-5-methylthio-1-phosphopentane phosphatase